MNSNPKNGRDFDRAEVPGAFWGTFMVGNDYSSRPEVWNGSLQFHTALARAGAHRTSKPVRRGECNSILHREVNSWRVCCSEETGEGRPAVTEEGRAVGPCRAAHRSGTPGDAPRHDDEWRSETEPR